MIYLSAAREVASRAQAAADLAENRLDEHTNPEYVDPALLERAYADGVEDVCRWLAGDTGPTEALTLVLRAGRQSGDDFPEDQPLGYPKIGA